MTRPDFRGPPVTASQATVLATLVELCPDDGGDVSARAVAERTGQRLGSVVVVLRSLLKRRLALLHEGTDDAWAPTMSGRSRVRYTRPAEDRRRSGGDEPPPERS